MWRNTKATRIRTSSCWKMRTTHRLVVPPYWNHTVCRCVACHLHQQTERQENYRQMLNISSYLWPTEIGLFTEPRNYTRWRTKTKRSRKEAETRQDGLTWAEVRSGRLHFCGPSTVKNIAAERLLAENFSKPCLAAVVHTVLSELAPKRFKQCQIAWKVNCQ